MFKSTVDKVYDYKSVNVSSEQLKIKIDKKIVEKELNKLAKKYAETVEADDAIRKGDQVIAKMESNQEKFNKENVPVAVGIGLFNKSLEDKLIGMKKNESNTFNFDGITVTVKILSIKRKIIPNVTDEMVKEQKIEGVNTVEEYKKYCYNQEVSKEKGKSFDTIYPMVRDEVVRRSEFTLFDEDIEKLLEVELDRCRVLSKKEGLIFEEMTREQLMIRVPAGSIEEFKTFLRKDFNEVLKWALIGKKIADGEKVTFNETTYNELMAELAAKDGMDMKTEKEEYPFLKYLVNRYGKYFMDKIKEYFETKFTYEEV